MMIFIGADIPRRLLTKHVFPDNIDLFIRLIEMNFRKGRRSPAISK